MGVDWLDKEMIRVLSGMSRMLGDLHMLLRTTCHVKPGTY